MDIKEKINAANEKANLLFRQGKIKFLQIAEMVEEAFEKTPSGLAVTLENIFQLGVSSEQLRNCCAVDLKLERSDP